MMSNLLEDAEEILPVEKQKIKGKIELVIATFPALDEHWATKRSFAYYVLPPMKKKSGEYASQEVENWLELMSFILDDFWWLSGLPYHKFWSQVIFDKGTLNSVKSFLRLAPLQKLYFKIENKEVLLMYKRIKHAVFQLLKRLTRPMESELHYMSEKKYMELMADKNFIPTSLIFCICTIYNKNEETVKIIDNLFRYNRNLKLDLAVRKTIQLFRWLKKKLNRSYVEMKKSVISCDHSNFFKIFNNYRQCLVTAIQCSTNTALCISSFLSVYRDGCSTFTDHDFEYHIIRIYKKLVLPLRQEIEEVFKRSCFDVIRSRLISMLNIVRSELLRVFYLCMESSVERLCHQRGSIDIIHNYAKIMKFALKVEGFMFDFTNNYNIDSITKSIAKNKCDLDITEIELINKSVKDFKEKQEIQNTNRLKDEKLNSLANSLNNVKLDPTMESSEFTPFVAGDKEEKRSNETVVLENSGDISSDYDDWNKDSDSDTTYGYLDDEEFQNISDKQASKKSSKEEKTNKESNQPGPSGIKIKSKNSCKPDVQSAIDQIKDVLPHYGDGFIVICLEYYKMDPTAVLNAILENNLAPELKSLNPQLPCVTNKLKISEVKFKSENSDKNLRELKKQKYSDYNELLDDKTDLKQMRNFYENYQIVEEDLYDDDVEEDYEENIGVIDTDIDTLLEHVRTASPINEECDNTTEFNRSSNRYAKPLDFCENPEIVRARAEQKRQANYERHRKNVYHNSSSSGKQGTDSEQTERDRHYKNVHKSRNANHSRRYLSDKKRKF